VVLLFYYNIFTFIGVSLAYHWYYLPINSLTTVYYSLVYSHLQYAICSWVSASPYLLKTIKTIQNKIISDYI